MDRTTANAKGGDGETERMKTTEQSSKITGPLGLWEFPILNAIASTGSNERVVVTEINRDSSGRIDSIEEIKL